MSNRLTAAKKREIFEIMHDEYTGLRKYLAQVKEAFVANYDQLKDIEQWEESYGANAQSTEDKAKLIEACDRAREQNKMLEDKKLVMQQDVSRAYDSWWNTHLDEQDAIKKAAAEAEAEASKDKEERMCDVPIETVEASSSSQSEAVDPSVQV